MLHKNCSYIPAVGDRRVAIAEPYCECEELPGAGSPVDTQLLQVLRVRRVCELSLRLERLRPSF